jgi:nucleotide-binding universal stress UspA family protein
MYDRLLVGTDGSDTATRAVEEAARLACRSGATLTIAYVFSPRPSGAQRRAWLEAPDDLRWRLTGGASAEAIVEAAADRARRAAGPALDLTGRCEPGHPITGLLRLVDELDVDALVIGNRDMAGRLRLHRSIGRALSRRASCHVVIVDTTGRRDSRRARSRRPALRYA